MVVVHPRLPCGEQLHSFHHGIRTDHESVPDHRGHSGAIEAGGAEQARGEQGPQLRGKGQCPARGGVGARREVERLDSQTVAGQEQRPAGRIPGGKGEHPAELGKRLCSAPGEHPQEHFGVAGGSNRLASGDEPPAELLVVVDLAVEDEHPA